MSTKNKSYLQLSFSVIILLLIGIKWAFHLSQSMDLIYGDEVEYLRNGVDLFSIIRSDWGPAYNIWYKFLSLFTHDNIQLYYLNFALGAILTTILLFIFLYFYKFNMLIALVISCFFFISNINISTWPRISHFVLFTILTTFIIIRFIPTRLNKLIFFTTIVIISSFARPELSLVFFICLPMAIFFWWKDKPALKKIIPFLLLLIICFSFFKIVFGNPADVYRGIDRKYIAFSQHYAINNKYQEKTDIDPVTEWIAYAQQEFPNCNDVPCIIKNYPKKFISNSLYNTQLSLLVWTSVINELLFPKKIIFKNKLAYLVLALFFLLMIMTLIVPAKRKIFFQQVKEYQLILFFTLLFAIPSILSCFIINPRMHYILMQIPLIVLFILMILQVWLDKIPFQNSILVILGIIFLVLSPKANDYNYFQIDSDMKNFCQQKTMRLLMKNDNKKHTIFSNYLNVTYLLPKNYSEFNIEYDYKKGMQFSKIIDSLNIDMVLMNEYIVQNKLLQQDTSWLHFLDNPSAYGFHKKIISNDCNSYILQK